MVQTGHNVAVAFGIVLLAGASTMIGAAIVFFPRLVKLASRRFLAGSLGFSAGVMIYVSFVEIIRASLDKFVEGGLDYDRAHVYVTMGLFGGTLIMIILDKIVHLLSHEHHGGHYHADPYEHSKVNDPPTNEKKHSIGKVPHCLGCGDGMVDPVKELEKWHILADEEISHGEEVVSSKTQDSADECLDSNSEKEDSAVDNIDIESSCCGHGHGLDHEHGAEDPTSELDKMSPDLQSHEDSTETCPASHSDSHGFEDEHVHQKKSVHEDPHESKKLKQTGIKTAVAIALHNFPEGLAVFATALDDPRIGGVLAFAIAMHNIPEGLCVALPLYYSTGKRCKAFALAALSGLSEPLAAFLGWLFLSRFFSDYVYAILLAIVAGMMIMISVKELLPTAHRFDPCDTVISYSFLFGMLVIAVSIELFHMFSNQHNHGGHESHSEEVSSTAYEDDHHGHDHHDHYF